MGTSRPGAALAARVEGGVVGEALADAVASAVGRRGAVGAAPAGVAREALAGVHGRCRASERRGPGCGGRAATQTVGVERRVVGIALADVVGAAPRRRGALVVIAAAGVAHEALSCRCRSRRRLAGRGRRLGRRLGCGLRRRKRRRWFGRALLFWVPRAPAVVREGLGTPLVAVLPERRRVIKVGRDRASFISPQTGACAVAAFTPRRNASTFSVAYAARHSSVSFGVVTLPRSS